MEASAAGAGERLGRPFWTLVTASALSNLADGIFKIALPLLAIQYTRSPAAVAGLELVRTLPWLIGALHVGALVDRVDRRRSMLAANAARVLCVAVPAIAMSLDRGSITLLYLAALGTGVAEVFYDTAAQSILPAVVPRNRLDRANGRLASTEIVMQEFVGPPAAGLLVAVAVTVSFAVPAVLWCAALAALVAVRGTFRPARAASKTTIRADLQEGLSFLLDRPTLRTMALMVGMSNFASSAVFAVLVLYAVGPGSALQLSEPTFGLLFAALAAGGVVGGLVADRVQRSIGPARTLTLSLFGMIAYVATPGLTTEVAVIAVVLFTSGIAMMMWNVITVSFRQRVTPDQLLGRVNSAYRLVAWGTRPIGAIAGGALGQWFGVRSVFLIMGVVAAAVLIPNRRLSDKALTAGELSNEAGK